MIKDNDQSGTSSEHYETDEEDCSSTEEDCSSGEPLAELFDVVAGECPGTPERIELLLMQLKTVDLGRMTEEHKQIFFDSVVLRAETDSLEDEPWITAVFSLPRYSEVAACMLPRVQKEMEKLPAEERANVRVLVAPRYTNLPDETVNEMYAEFGEHPRLPKEAKLSKETKLLVLSADHPISAEEEAEVKGAFSRVKLPSLRGRFPWHPEDIFFTINRVAPLFSFKQAQHRLTGWLINKKQLEQFITSLVEFNQIE